MDVAIAIRTGVLKDGVLNVQAGGRRRVRLVARSRMAETEAKARAVLRAAEMVEAGLSHGDRVRSSSSRRLVPICWSDPLSALESQFHGDNL